MPDDLLCCNYKKKPNGGFEIKSKPPFFNTESADYMLNLIVSIHGCIV